MKKYIFILVLELFIVGAYSYSLIKEDNENHSYQAKGNYLAKGVVVELDREFDVVYVELEDGNIFSFYGIEDWFENDTCTLSLNDKGTREIEDDSINWIRYTGWIE